MKFLLVVFLALQLGTVSTWSMDCDHYWAAVERLNQDPFYQKKENASVRWYVLRLYRARTPEHCYEQYVQQNILMADKAIEPGKKSTERYLPEKAWAAMSKAERKKTDDKKKRESRKGKQFVENTERAKKARRAVSKAEKRKMGQS